MLSSFKLRSLDLTLFEFDGLQRIAHAGAVDPTPSIAPEIICTAIDHHCLAVHWKTNKKWIWIKLKWNEIKICFFWFSNVQVSSIRWTSRGVISLSQWCVPGGAKLSTYSPSTMPPSHIGNVLFKVVMNKEPPGWNILFIIYLTAQQGTLTY